MIDINSVLPWLSLALGLIAIYGFYNQRRQAAMEKGKRESYAEQLRKDIDHVAEKVRKLETEAQCVEVDMAEVKTDIKHILAALSRIEKKLES